MLFGVSDESCSFESVFEEVEDFFVELVDIVA